MSKSDFALSAIQLFLSFYLKIDEMHDERPSRTAYKVALNILTLGTIPEMAEILPFGIVDTTEKLVIASGAASERPVHWSRSSRMGWFPFNTIWFLPAAFVAWGIEEIFKAIREK